MGDGDNSPASVIHSVADDANANNETPVSPTGAGGKKANGKGVRQSNNALSVSNIRRIFSPTYERKSNANPPPVAIPPTTSDEDGAAGSPSSSSSSPPPSPITSVASSGSGAQGTPRRKNVFSFIRACFVPTQDDSMNVSPVDPMNILRQIRDCVPTYEPEHPLLPPAEVPLNERVCLVLDLDETLVHSSFTPIPDPDFEIPLEMQGETHMVYVKKRPFVDQFLKVVCAEFEVIVFTASLALYANPVMDLLDPERLVHGRLYREHCVFTSGCYVKDISKLGRPLNQTLIVDNSPLSYALQPENAVPISSFISDDNDRELEKTLKVVQGARQLPDVRNLYS